MPATGQYDLLVAYDDTEAGRRAVEFAADEAAMTGESVEVVHVGTDLKTAELRDDLGGVFTERNVVVGFQTVPRGGSDEENVSVSAKLSERIAAGGYRMVVLGNEKRGLLETLTEGSVTASLIEDQAVPVTLVP